MPDTENPVVKKYYLTELVYHISRITNDEKPMLPWGPFHVMLSVNSAPVSTIAFNPILMAPPTDYSTIYTTLLRNKEIISNLGFEHLPIFFDMGLLTKALEVTWARPRELSGIFPCDGGMHLLMSVMAGIGHLYGNAGLQQLLHDSGVYAAGTAQRILLGKDFDRGLHAMKLIDDVLHSQFVRAFYSWCEVHEVNFPFQITKLKDQLQQEVNMASQNKDKISILVCAR